MAFIHEHYESQLPNFRASMRPHKTNLKRNREGDHVWLCKEYFTNPLFSEYIFSRRFWISKKLILPILDVVRDHDSYFKYKMVTIGKVVFTSNQKCSATVLMLAYGVARDLVNEYMRMSYTTCLESTYTFCKEVGVWQSLSERAKCSNISQLLSINESRGFLGMLGSIDFMHWVEELSFWFRCAIYRACGWVNNHIWGSCITRSLNLTWHSNNEISML
jgi:hypothetical protein